LIKEKGILVQEKAPSFVVTIPTEYLDQFESDATKAWESFGSFAQHSSAPYFENISRVHRAVSAEVNPFDNDTYTFSPLFMCVDQNYRYMHVDLALNKDACCISMCHVSDWIEVPVALFKQRGKAPVIERGKRPVYTFDFLGQIKADKGEEIKFSDVRELIYEVTKRGFPIQMITYDGFQSVDSIQILRDKGYLVGRLSIDRTATYPVVDIDAKDSIRRLSTGGGKFSTLAAWSSFKSAINTGRVILPHYLPVTDTIIDNYGTQTKNVDDMGKILKDVKSRTLIEKEMSEAIYNKKDNKVHEPPKGSIDLLESAVGAVFNASNNVTSFYTQPTASELRQQSMHEMENATLIDQEDMEMDNEGYDDSSWERLD